jgi:hypothetical protein
MIGIVTPFSFSAITTMLIFIGNILSKCEKKKIKNFDFGGFVSLEVKEKQINH